MYFTGMLPAGSNRLRFRNALSVASACGVTALFTSDKGSHHPLIPTSTGRDIPPPTPQTKEGIALNIIITRYC